MYVTAMDLNPSLSKRTEDEAAQKRLMTAIRASRTRHVEGNWVLESVDPMGQVEKLMSQSSTFRRDSAILLTANVYPSVRDAWNVREFIQCREIPSETSSYRIW